MPRKHDPLQITTRTGHRFRVEVTYVRGDHYYEARLWRDSGKGGDWEAVTIEVDKEKHIAVGLVLQQLAYALFGEVPRERKGGGRDGHDRPGDGEPG